MERSRKGAGNSPQESGAGAAGAGQAKARAYWRANTRIIWVLLLIWVVAALGMSLLLPQWLNKLRVGRLPLGFWWAQQGAIFVFVAIVFTYAWYLDRLEGKSGARE